MKRHAALGLDSLSTDKSFAYTADLLAAIFTWGGIGWLVDRWLDTTPIVMVLGFIVGNMSGIYLLYIRSRDGASMSTDEPRPDTTPSHTDSERP
jgi:F0F1-type ATP synthase assembly protein I